MSRVWQFCAVLAMACAVYMGAAGAALASSDGRVFEKVSPDYKGGSGATKIEAVALNGESVAYFAPAAFSGAPIGTTQNLDGLAYISRRTAEDWKTAPVQPPATAMPVAVGENRDIAPDLNVTLALGNPGPNSESAEEEATGAEFLIHDTNSMDASQENWPLAGEVIRRVNFAPLRLRYLGASQDFCHLLFDEGSDSQAFPFEKPLLPEAEGAKGQLYELTRGCNDAPVTLRLVGVNNSGEVVRPGCRPDLGIEGYGQEEFANGKGSAALHVYNAISANGATIFFTTCVHNNELKDSQTGDHQLFVRLGGLHTVEVSKPLTESCGEEIPCPEATKRASAYFAGASEDGSIVYFTTAAPLDGATDKDAGNDLYMARIGCPSGAGCALGERRVTSLAQVSRAQSSGEADVQGVVRVSPDGTRVYFVAFGDLLPNATQARLEAERRTVPQVGADNLYEYDNATGEVEFVADLCSGHDSSGLVEDGRCLAEGFNDATLWMHSEGTSCVQTAGADGRFLLFSSYGQLTSDDTNASRDVYRFDAVHGALERVSLGEGGYGANGNAGNGDASIVEGHFGGSVRYQLELNSRAISEDGSRVVFETARRLSPAAVNGLTNVYEWHEGADGFGGSVSLLSGGTGSTSVEDAVISPSGRDVFFSTSEGLVPQDTDGVPDVYDARLGGGFPPVPTDLEACSGDACQGPLTNPAPLLVPASISQTAGENFEKAGSGQKAARCVRGRKRAKRGRCVKAKKKKKKAVIGRRGNSDSNSGGGRS